MQEELFQVGWITVWQEESGHEGETPSYYLQRCQFAMRHYLEQGRSIVSWKRRRDRHLLPGEFEEADWPDPLSDWTDDIRSSACARDLIRVLWRWIGDDEKMVILDLAKGLRIEDIAQHLMMSHQDVSKHRQRIRRVAEAAGICLH